MIRVVLLGRTGNNLFQYALGRVLAEKHGVPLVLDASWYNAEGWAEVSHFLKLRIRARVVRPFSLASRALRNLGGKHYWELIGKPILREPADNQSFDPRFLEAPADCVLFGYFQSHRYFQDISEKLGSELNGLFADSAVSHRIHDELRHPNSVAVHVRRGDYLDHPGLAICDEAYHRRAMDLMRKLVSNPRFHIFSDDREWCLRTFTDPDTEVRDSGELAANPLHDLRLMSLASHHIIANSTYSWWAAWLGRKAGQRVIMPSRWNTGDCLVPINEKAMPDWLTIDCDAPTSP